MRDELPLVAEIYRSLWSVSSSQSATLARNEPTMMLTPTVADTATVNATMARLVRLKEACTPRNVMR